MQPLPPPAANAEQSTKELIARTREVLLRRRWWFAFSALLTMAATVVMTRAQPKIYRASGSVYIAQSAPRVLSGVREVVDLGTGGYWGSKQYYQAQVEILRSRELSQMVVDRLGLATDPHFHRLDGQNVKLTEDEKRDRMMRADHAGLLAGRVRIKLGKTAMITHVSVEDTDPEFARDLVNALLEAYKDRNIQLRGRATRVANRELKEILADMQGRKTSSESKLFEFETKNDLSTNRRLAVNERILALERSLREVQRLRFSASQRMHTMRKFRRGKSMFSLGSNSLMEDSLLARLKERKLDLSLKRQELEASYLSQHPRLLSVAGQEERLNSIARKHLDALYSASTIAYKDAMAQEKEILRQLGTARDEDRRIRALQAEHNRLVSKRDEDKRFYDLVAKRMTETDLSGQVDVNNVRILDPAITPKGHIRPDARLNYAAGFLLSLIVGLGTALGVNMLDSSIKGRYEVEEILKVPYLGAIPKFEAPSPEEAKTLPAGHADLYAHYRPNSRVAEASRTLRTNILFMRPDKPIRTLVVSSALPREGKTATSATIAIALGAANGSCILVDTDLRKPRLHKVFGHANDAGVTSYVLTGRPVDEFVKQTDVPGLDLLTCGPLPPNSSEIMHTERFRELVRELADKYETVVFDSSPIEIVSDALVLATLADGVIMVAHANVSKLDVIGSAIHSVRSVNANLLGVVLSRTETTGSGYGYYYGKGYRRGGKPYRYRYAANEEDDSPRKAG